MATSLGRILKYGINRSQENVTVREEIEHLKDYILLQKIRFEDIFTISVDIQPEIYEYIIIKMILQPVVENAIYHGLSKVAEGGRIRVAGYQYKDSLLFEVTDTGEGMEEEVVIRLNEYINGQNSSFNSIGLKNVNRRIKLKYGNEYGLKITSKLQQGTKVEILLPAVIYNTTAPVP
jgi:two-component system sensor histidine kinase YesM